MWYDGRITDTFRVGNDLGWFFNLSFWQSGLFFFLLLIGTVIIVRMLKKDLWSKSLLAGLGMGLILGLSTLGLFLGTEFDGGYAHISADAFENGDIFIFGTKNADWSSTNVTSVWETIIWQDYVDNKLDGFTSFIVIDKISGFTDVPSFHLTGSLADFGSSNIYDFNEKTGQEIILTIYYGWETEINAFTGIISGIFVAGLQFMVVPLIMVVLIKSMLSGGSGKRDQKIFGLTLVMALVGVGLAGLIAISMTPILSLINWSNFDIEGIKTSTEANNIFGMIRGWVPSSISGILSGAGAIVGVIIVTIFLGFVLQTFKKQGRRDITDGVESFLAKSQEIINEILDRILTLIPLVIMTALPKFFMGDAINNFTILGFYLLSIYLGTILVMIVHSLVALWISKPKGKNIFGLTKDYVKVISPLWLQAFVTQSSFGCLPKTIQTAEDLGVSEDVSATTSSLGTSMGLTICGGLFPTIVAILSAKAFNIEMNAAFWIQLIIVEMIIGLGIAGVPGTATVSTIALLTAMGIPTGAYVPLISMEQLVDPIRTMGNVNSTINNCMIVDTLVTKSEKKSEKKNLFKPKNKVKQ